MLVFVAINKKIHLQSYAGVSMQRCWKELKWSRLKKLRYLLLVTHVTLHCFIISYSCGFDRSGSISRIWCTNISRCRRILEGICSPRFSHPFRFPPGSFPGLGILSLQAGSDEGKTSQSRSYCHSRGRKKANLYIPSARPPKILAPDTQ